MKAWFLLGVCFFISAADSAIAQNPSAAYINPVSDQAVLGELQRISRSVQNLSEALKSLTEVTENAKGGPSQRQQRLMLGMDMLVKTEERVSNFQKLQIDLVEKLNENRGKLSQVEIDLRPRNIDRSTAFEGTTETQELRDSRRVKLLAERTSLTALLTQIQTTLNETLESLTDAQGQAYRLRKTILPQLERELTDP
jgi:hypothetical protein